MIKKLYSKYKIKIGKYEIKNTLPYRFGLRDIFLDEAGQMSAKLLSVLDIVLR